MRSVGILGDMLYVTGKKRRKIKFLRGRKFYARKKTSILISIY